MKIYYKKKSQEVKKLSTRVAKLQNKFDVLLHYWKVACKKRKTFEKTKKNYRLAVTHVETLEKRLAKLFNCSKKLILRKNHERTYPFFASHNEIGRIRQYFKRPLPNLPRVAKKRGIVVLSQRELLKLRGILKPDYSQNFTKRWAKHKRVEK